MSIRLEGSPAVWSVDPRTYIPEWGTKTPLRYTDLTPDAFDRMGRPVKEREEPNPAGVLFEKSPFRFPDSREGMPVLDSAFMALAPNIRMSFAILSVLYRRMLGSRRNNPKPEDHASVLEAGIMLPNWYVLKADEPVENGKIPSEIAGVAKICRGLAVPFQLIDIEQVAARYEKRRPRQEDLSFLEGPEEFYGYVDTNQLLIETDDAGNKIACPAPRGLIERGAQVMLGKNSPITEAMEVEAEALLQLTDQDILRIKELGRASRIIQRETFVYDRCAVAISAINAKLYEAQGFTSPLDLPRGDSVGQFYKGQAEKTYENITYAEKLANEALRRDRPRRPVERTDLPGGPRFVVKKTI